MTLDDMAEEFSIVHLLNLSHEAYSCADREALTTILTELHDVLFPFANDDFPLSTSSIDRLRHVVSRIVRECGADSNAPNYVGNRVDRSRLVLEVIGMFCDLLVQAMTEATISKQCIARLENILLPHLFLHTLLKPEQLSSIALRFPWRLYVTLKESKQCHTAKLERVWRRWEDEFGWRFASSVKEKGVHRSADMSSLRSENVELPGTSASSECNGLALAKHQVSRQSNEGARSCKMWCSSLKCQSAAGIPSYLVRRKRMGSICSTSAKCSSTMTTGVTVGETSNEGRISGTRTEPITMTKDGNLSELSGGEEGDILAFETPVKRRRVGSGAVIPPSPDKAYAESM